MEGTLNCKTCRHKGVLNPDKPCHTCIKIYPEGTDNWEPKVACFGKYNNGCKDNEKSCGMEDDCFAETNYLTGKGPAKVHKTAPKNNLKEGKPRASLIPWDILIEYLTPSYEEGVHKYERESWRQGFNISVLYDALQRHLTAFFYKREDIDPESTKPGLRVYHLGAAMFCILSMLWTLKTKPELDDRPNFEPKKE